MTYRLAFCLIFLSFLGTACNNSKSYSLEELEKNQYNDLKIPATAALPAEGFDKIFNELGAMNRSQILEKLTSKGLELHQASFCFYYLANAYAKEKDLENFLKYHQIAAHQYINPQSLLKLAEFNFFKEKNFAKSYEYLHQSLEVTVEITDNNRSHPLAKNGSTRAQNILLELDKLSANNQFDKEALRQKLKAELPALLNKYREIYGLGPREGSWNLEG